MKTEVHYSHLDHSEALDTYIRSRVEPTVKEFLNRHDFHTQIWVSAEHSPYKRGAPPVFTCEIDVRYPPKREVFIQKMNAEVHQAINAAIDALKVTLREISKRELGSRQHVSRVYAL